MKRLITLLVALISAFTCVFATGCGDDKTDISVYAPDGAPALSIAKFINDNEAFGTEKTFNYNIVSSAEINNAIISEKADMVIMPLNDATKIYKKDDNGAEDYVMAAVITHGNFYVMSKNEITAVGDLIGKVVYVPMRGKVPDLTFQAALKINEIDYVESDVAVAGKVAIKYYGQPKDYLPLLIKNQNNDIGLVPEPAAANANSKGVNYVLDLQELFDKDAKAYPQAVLMVKKSLVDNNPTLAIELAGAFAENVNWVKGNASKAVDAIKAKFDATTLDPATLSAKSVENCKIYWQGGAAAKTAVNNYIAKIREIDVNSANAVDDAFFM